MLHPLHSHLFAQISLLHFVAQHLKFVALQLLNHFILSVPLVRPLYWLVLCNPLIMTDTLHQYQYTSHFLQVLKLSFLKLGRATLPFYCNVHGTNVI